MPVLLSLLAVLIASLLSGCSRSPQASTPQGGRGSLAEGPKILIVCPIAAMVPDCAFSGGGGIQAAVDAAVDGDTVQIRPGTYRTNAARDVPYKIHTIRGFVVIDGKRLSLVGEPGAVLDGSAGPPTTGLVIHRFTVDVQGFEAHATENSRIWVGYSALFGNENTLLAKDSAVMRKGATIEADPKLDAEYRLQARSPLADRGDPECGTPVGSASQNRLR